MSAADPPPMTRREWRRREEQARRSAGTGRPAPALSLDLDGAFEQAPRPDGHGGADPHAPAEILIVCTGNICRSPLAEVLLRERLSGVGVVVRSAGTHALTGHGMSPEAQELAVRLGGDPSAAAAHRGRLLDEELLLTSDLVLTMTAEHSTFTVQRAPARLRQVFAVRTFARLSAGLSDADLQAIAQEAGTAPRARLDAVVRAVGERRGIVPAQGEEEVSDPYRRGMAAYERSAAELIPALDEVVRVVRTTLVTTS